MAINGPAPKANGDRERRNAPTFSDVRVVADGKLRGPRLPKEFTWCDRTREWWEVWRRSANAMVMTDTDWEHLLETALLHNMLWSGSAPNGRENGAVSATQLAAEIRQRVTKLGATVEDRMKLRMSIVTPQSEQDKEDRLKSEVAEGINYLEQMKDYINVQKDAE